MAYLNFEYCKNKGLTNMDIIAIQLIHQNSNGDMEEYLEDISRDVLNKLFRMELLKLVKQMRKTQETRNRVRLSNIGKRTYTSMTAYKSNDDDIKIHTFLSDVFKKLEKQQPSRSKMLKLIAAFRLESGLSAKEIYELCKVFVNDDDAMEWTHKLDYVFFKPENHYSKFSLGDSRLWDYYENKMK